MLKKKVLLLIFLIPSLLFAQTKDHPWNMGFHFGKSEVNADIGDASFDWKKPYYGFGGMSISHYATRSIDGFVNFNYGELGYWADNDTLGYVNNKFHNHFYGKHVDGTVFIKYKLSNGHVFKENSRFQLSLILGVGLSWMWGPYVYTIYSSPQGNSVLPGYITSKDFIISSGWHFNIKLSRRFNFYEQSIFVYTDHDSRDGYSVANNDGYLLHQAGITYNFGRSLKESFSNIVEEKASKGKKVDCNCNLFDRDSDGIIDKFDLCPDVPGIVQARGCPDSDWDGIPDFQDSCPTVWGTARFHGCPDTDGDGIPDNLDSCPTIKGYPQFHGCPDTDGDGIPDNLDSCPFTKGSVKFSGCPDSDGDGIPDNRDKCPREAGPASNGGCPEIKESVKKIFEQALTGIQFQTAKSIILPKSFPILDNVVKVCKENPTYYLIINGHTDNQGDADKNMKLSDDRASAVKFYLIKKGVPANRLESHGFGQTVPIDNNETPEGRAKNRRVEFRVKIIQ